MRLLHLLLVCFFAGLVAGAQPIVKTNHVAASGQNPNNIYAIKKIFLEKVLHNPNETNKGEADNDLARFNRWFNFVEPRCYPTGNLPHQDALLQALDKQQQTPKTAAKTTSGVSAWQPLGPSNVPPGFFGIGRVNCIVNLAIDTNTLYIGTAGGGVWISHNGGVTWTSNCDNFPVQSIADIAVNPVHPDTLYAATGDGYGYSVGGYNIFWGGLYSAGVMKSTDGGASWHTTGLSYAQSDNTIIQKLIIHPNHPNILLAATTHGTYRTTDGGTTWTIVDTGHVYSLAFHPTKPDTIYAVNSVDFRISYNRGLTWHTGSGYINTTDSRCTIAVSPAAPLYVWVLNDNNALQVSMTEGNGFFPTSAAPPTMFYGYYDRVLGVSPTNPNFIVANGMNMYATNDGGTSWNQLDNAGLVHPDNHAIAFNPLNPHTIYTGNDGGFWVTRDDGNTWTMRSDGLMISQIYRLSSSRQNPNIMLCGLQDNGTFYNDGTMWYESNMSLGDGMDNAISPQNDSIQVASTQYGNFSISTDKGASFNSVGISASGTWTSPVIINPHNKNNIFFGFDDIWATYDLGASFVNLTNSSPFSGGAISMALAPSNSNVLYAADYSHILVTNDGGTTWNDVTGTLPITDVAIVSIAVDYTNPMLVYVTMSGYFAGEKAYKSSTGGTTWTNISGTLPNIPVDCIAVDSSTPGALYIGTDIGVYYRDGSVTDWSPYLTGLPNIIVDDLDVNYTNDKLIAATYGRGVWESDLKKYANLKEKEIGGITISGIQVLPNPTTDIWQLVFSKQPTSDYTVVLYDINGKKITSYRNTNRIDASRLSVGTYNIELVCENEHHSCKAIKK